MKRGYNCRVFSMAVLIMLAVDCKSDDNIFESTTAVSYTTIYHGTSSNKIYSASNEFKVVQFVQINRTNLTFEMASGGGEYLSTLADLLGVSPAQKTVFYSMTKTKFSQLFPTTETTPEQLVNSLKVEIGKLGKA